jgi:acyl-CoA synthetase (AMP-forming)/AMP-acid ligase II
VSICTILSMAAAALPERQAFGRTTFGALDDEANRGASWLRGEASGRRVVHLPNFDPATWLDLIRGLLRGSRTPDEVAFRDELPQTPTGKILRRHLVAELAAQTPAGVPAGDVAEPACT